MDDIKSISQGYLRQLWINPYRRPVLYQLGIFERPKSTKKLLCGLERRGCFQRGGVIYKRGNSGCKQNKDSTICNFPVGNLSPDRRTDTDLYKNSGSRRDGQPAFNQRRATSRVCHSHIAISDQQRVKLNRRQLNTSVTDSLGMLADLYEIRYTISSHPWRFPFGSNPRKMSHSGKFIPTTAWIKSIFVCLEDNLHLKSIYWVFKNQISKPKTLNYMKVYLKLTR